MNLANRITLARIGLIPLFIALLAEYPLWLAERSSFIRIIDEYGPYLALAVFLLASATDKLDGYVARTYKQITNLGKLLDPLADKLLVSAALIMMVQSGMVLTWIAVVLIAREIIMTGLRLTAAGQGIALAADRFGKWKMALQVAAIAAVLLDHGPLASVTLFWVDEALMFAAAAMTLFSAVHYIAGHIRLLGNA